MFCLQLQAEKRAKIITSNFSLRDVIGDEARLRLDGLDLISLVITCTYHSGFVLV